MMTFEDLGILTKPGLSRYYTICPECNDKRQHHKGAKCLTVNDEPDNRWYKCHHCGWSGNLDAQGKYEKVREKSGIPNQQRTYTLDTRNYLESRGISQNTAKKARIYEQTQNGRTILAFPYFMHMTLVNVKFLNMKWKKGDKGPKWWQISKDDGTRILPFGTQLIKTHDDQGVRFNHNILIITEGEWDMLTWLECGYPNAVSVPQGAPALNSKNFEKEFQYLQDKYVQSAFKDIDRFYLSIDNDDAGKKLRENLAMILGKEKCRYIRYPIGYKDINEVLVGNKEKNLPALGKKGVAECLDNSSSVPIRGIVKASHVRDEIRKLREGGFEPGFGCGVEEVDYLFTVKPPLIQFTTGIPGAGKSVWSRWWLTEFLKHNQDKDFKWALFTPENRPPSREYAKICEALTGLSIQKGQKNSMSDEQYQAAMRFVEKHFFIISPDKYNYESFGNQIEVNQINTLNSIQRYLMYLKKTENIFGYVIDAWNKIEHEQPKWQSETSFISEQLDKLIDFNAYWGVFGNVIVHPRKIEMSGENYKMPSLYDIKGSSAWKEKADIGLILHRYKMKKVTAEQAAAQGISLGDLDEDEKYEVVEKAPTIVRTEKIRFEEIGHENRVKMEMSSWGQFSVVKKEKKPKENIPDPDSRIQSLFDDTDDDSDLPF